jgi:hypothetical protein
VDPHTGDGSDGLHADGMNSNQGAESTLAVTSTLQTHEAYRLCRNDFGPGRAVHAPLRIATGCDAADTVFRRQQQGSDHRNSIDGRMSILCRTCVANAAPGKGVTS